MTMSQGGSPGTYADHASRLSTKIGDVRPLDPLNSLKTKLGVLVVASVLVATGLVTIGIGAGVQARYMVLIAVAASLAVTQLLAHGMTAPLREMTAAAHAMAKGDYSRRVRATAHDEVGQLAATFNQMAADLAEVDRNRRELVANVSHELRTPISALRALLENVVDGVSDPDAATMRTALEQTERLGRLVTQLLDLSRIDSGAVPLAVEDFAVAPFLAGAAREAEATGRPVRIKVAVNPAGLYARADRERLHQVVANLLDNACRHSPPGSTVAVTAGRNNAPGSLWVEVADEGPGIPVEERTRVFERFIRGGSSSSSDGGTGLGLAIARWAVDLHGGDIGVAESARGCRIRVVLPGHAP